MDTLRSFSLAVCCLIPAFAASPTAIPLAFEQREPALFIVHSTSASVRFQPDRVAIGEIALRFLNARPARLEGIGPVAPATYMGDTGRQTFQQYPRLAMRRIYAGIDAVFYGHDGHLEYDLEVAPGGEPSALRLRFENARSLRLSDNGALLVEAASGALQQLPPRVFQAGRPIAAHYLLTGANEAAIRLGKYDRRLALTIDPELVYANYFGGSGSDAASAVATDSQGNVYLAGSSNSLDFPSAAGSTSRPLPSLIALTNAGQSVTQITIGQGRGVTAIGGTPDGKILYAASGSTVYYSSNSGASWIQTSAIPAATSSFYNSPLAVTDISVDAIDPSRAFVATNRGLFSTGDNGNSWFPRDYDLAAYYDGSIQASSVTISQVDHTVTYVTTGNPNFLYKSTDAGGTFTMLNATFSGEPVPPPFPASTIIFTMAPGGSDLYVVDANGYLFKSVDAGVTWQKLYYGIFGAKAIRIDPNNNANIFVQDSSGVQKSTDGGSSFTTVNPPGLSSPINQVTAIAYDGVSKTLYVAAASFIFASTDQGSTWQVAPLSPINIHVLQAIGGRVFVGLDTPQTSFLVKLDPTGAHLLYSTFFTGKSISGVMALRVDSQGNAYLAGNTISPNFTGATKIFGVASPTFFTAYVAKVSQDGSTLAYLSGFGASHGLSVTNLAIDSSGAAYITGYTQSGDFPTTAGAFQAAVPTSACTRPPDSVFFSVVPNQQTWAYVSKLSRDGSSLAYSTFVTGSCGSAGQGIAVNSAGEAFVVGSTTSPDMPVSPNAYQSVFPGPLDKTSYPNAVTAGFAAHLSAAGDQVLGGTLVGGGYTSSVSAITLDSAGNPILTGATWGIAPGATTGAYQKSVVYNCAEPIGIFGPPQPPSQGYDAFVLKLDPAFSKAAYLTYLGGSCADSASAIALDPAGNTWVAGTTNSADFPVVAPYQAKSSNGGFVSELSPDGSKLLFSSFSEGNALALDPQGFVYVAGSTTSATLAKNANSSFLTDVALAKIDSTPNPTVEIDKVVGVVTPTLGQITFATQVAPGEMAHIQGHNLGPAAKVSAQLDSSGTLPFTLGGTRVLFDGVAAPLNSVQSDTIELFVPFEVKGATKVTVVANGQTSNTLNMGVTAVASEILAIYNQDGSPNSAASPARQGSVVVVYMSGLGQTTPPGVDGTTNTAPPSVPVAPVGPAYIGQYQVPPQFVAAAVGATAGVSQVNVQVPVGQYPASPMSITISQASAPIYIAQ